MPLGFFILKKRKKIINFILLLCCYIFFKLKIISNKRFKEIYLYLVFNNLKENEIKEFVLEFEKDFIKKNLNAELIDEIKKFIEEGDKLIIVSSNFDIFLKKLNLLKNFEILATEVFFDENKKCYKIKGNVCKDFEKIRKLADKYSEKIFETGIFYGDSEDRVLLQKFKNSVEIK